MEKELTFVNIKGITIDEYGVLRNYNKKITSIMRGTEGKDGYMRWWYLHKGFLVHRLVAMAFVPNPNNEKYINHLDGIKTNNYKDNLKWVSAQENNLHSMWKLKNKCIPIRMYSLEGDYLRDFPSYEEAQCFLGRPGKKGVWEACNNLQKRPKGNAYGFHWEKL